ncbi:MAG TPA: NADH:ubiquinone oxidoreductase, partial [Syntrophothermus lipocalidus]|nr:NADH:ubiquinone oxidoreductase [Syntrophothermus lipocalidus]
LKTVYDQMNHPKVVVAVGICATSGNVFHQSYNCLGGVDKVVPVDVYVPGCAARPEAIIDGIFLALKKLEEKRRDKDASHREVEPTGTSGQGEAAVR